ncbi:MAG TPA: TonB-dependent receptor [Terriglobales bacterium]|nr:TonB-dependent receptor [Terriglobales bacterium]
MIGVAAAQSTTEGAIGGTVVDNTGAVVSKAPVTAHNNATNAEKSTITDSAGYYRITQLQPGSYTVTVKQSGFAPYKASEVIVQVGTVTELSPKLAVGGTVETVDVSSETPQINYNTPELAPVLNQASVENLPINGGRWSNFTLLTPTVVSDSSGFGLVSFRGISVLLNNNTVDGADNNQAFFSEERGRTRAGYSTPKVAIEEFQVNTSNYSAEYGRSAGGVTNTVTKSGTNGLHGEAYFYDRDAGWGAANAFTKIATQDPTTGAFNLKNFKPKDWRKMTGFGIGGPIIKDKLFFFLAFDYYLRNFPGTAVASNPNSFLATPSAATISTLATRLGVTTGQAATIYNNDLFGTPTTPGLISMLGPVPRTGEQNIFFPKIDWQITPKHHAAFSFNRMRWASPSGIQTQATNTNGRASFGNDFVKDTWGVAKLDSTLTSNIVNELRYQYGRDFEFEFTQKPTPYEISTLVNASSPSPFTNPLGLPPQVSITNGFTFGVPTFLQRTKFPDETRHQIADTVNWTHGNHNLKFGVDFSHVDDLSVNLRTQFGSYSYGSLLAYFSDLNKQNTCGTAAVPRPCYTSYSQAFGPLGFEFTTNDYAFFGQDDWKILPRLSLSMGLRYEYEQLPSPFSKLANPLAPAAGHMPSDKNNIGPRIGFAYDIFGDGKTVLRGGYGIYYGRIINSTIYNGLTQTGVTAGQVSYSLSPTSTVTGPCTIPFPQILAAPPTCTGAKPSIAFFAKNFQNPQIHQTDLTLEHDLGWGSVLSVSYIGSLGRNLPGFVDSNIAPATGTVTYKIVNGGPITAPTITEPLFTSRIDPNFGSTTIMFSGINSSYNALVAQVNHRMNHHVQFSVNYTWAHAIDFGQNQSTFSDTNDLLVPNNLALEKGNSIYDVRHRFVFHALMSSPWKVGGWLGILANDWELDPVYQIQNGLPYSLTTSGSAPGGLNGGVNGSGGAFRIDATGRNTFRQPMTWVSDIRIAKHFKVQEKYEMELIGDFFNLANKQNVTSVNNTGYFVSTTNLQTPTGSVTCTTLAPCLNFDVDTPANNFKPLFGSITNTNSNFTYSPRQIQVGLRVKF